MSKPNYLILKSRKEHPPKRKSFGANFTCANKCGYSFCCGNICRNRGCVGTVFMIAGIFGFGIVQPALMGIKWSKSLPTNTIPYWITLLPSTCFLLVCAILNFVSSFLGICKNQNKDNDITPSLAAAASCIAFGMGMLFLCSGFGLTLMMLWVDGWVSLGLVGILCGILSVILLPFGFALLLRCCCGCELFDETDHF